MKILSSHQGCDMEMCQNESVHMCQEDNVISTNYKMCDNNQESSSQKCVIRGNKQEYLKHTIDQMCFLEDCKDYKELSDRNHMKYEHQINLSKSVENLTNSKCTSNNTIITPIKETLQISYNPFEVKPESLQLQSFSPSVFATFHTTDKKTKTFRWSIDQIATLKPAEIDETSQQETGLDLDAEMEEKAQKAIETFFSRNNVVPSPWGTLAKHVTFSPNLASTAYYANAEESLNISQVSYFNQNTSTKKNVWTQTQLTVPPHINIMDILGPAFTFQGDCCQIEDVIETSVDTDSFGNSSLRRKLFSHGNESTPTGVTQKPAPSMKLWSPPVTPQPSIPPEENSHICTPGSTQFSSSPITPRNCSMSIGIPASPLPVSPIAKSMFKTPSTGSRSDGINPLPDSFSSTNKQEIVGREPLPLSPMNVCSANEDLKLGRAVDCSVIQTGIEKVEEKDTFQCSVTDMSCDESMINHNNYSEVPPINVNKAKTATFNFVKEPFSSSNCQEMESQELKKDDQFDSNPNSMAQDTGYQTASLQSITQSSQGCLRSEFVITDSVVMPNSIYENVNIFHNEIDRKDYNHRGVQEKDNCIKDKNGCKTNVQLVSFQEQCSTSMFNPLSWQPTKCSTPTKVHLSEIKPL